MLISVTINNNNNNDYVSLAFSGIPTGGILRSWTAHDWSPSTEPTDLWISRMAFGRTKNHWTLIDRLTRVIVVGLGDHFAQLVYINKRLKYLINIVLILSISPSFRSKECESAENAKIKHHTTARFDMSRTRKCTHKR